MKRPDTTAPRTRRAPVGLWLAALVWSIACWPGLAEQGQDTSGLFTVDTRWGFSEGAAVSRLLTVDTRLSGSTGTDSSGVFTVDTTGAAVGNARIAGRVTDTLGAGLGSATVAALQNSVVRAQVGTDPAGHYQLNALPAGTCDLRAARANHLTGVGRGVFLIANETKTQDFALEPKPAVAEVETVLRPAETIVLRQVAGNQLRVFEGDHFVSGGWFDPAKPTVIMTHGWNSDPEVWATAMARAVVQGNARANILCWDWSTAAGTGLFLSLAWSATPYQGEALGRKLAETFTPAYQEGVHFIGHSLGTLVNARAADYLHQEAGSDFEWLRQKTHLTLLDDAEIANVEGRLVPFAFLMASNWVSPIPEYSRWIDNYISLVGGFHPEAVNVWLLKAPKYGDTSNPLAFFKSVHRYAADWYSRSAALPERAVLGNRYSYEHQGAETGFADPGQFQRGSVFGQDLAAPGQDELIRLSTREQLVEAANYSAAQMGQYVLGSSLNAAAGVAQKAGEVALDVLESDIVQPGLSGPVSPTGMIGGLAGYVSDWLWDRKPVWSFQLNLRASPRGAGRPAAAVAQATGTPRMHGLDDPASAAPRAWIPVAVPTNAALFSFDFTLTGDPGEDLLSASIAGTNVFLLEGRFMPATTLLNSGPIDVSQWAGQTVEFFFGFLGETASGAALTVGGMRFYEVEAPRLTAELVAGGWLLSWPAAAEGYVLESAPALSEPMDWSEVPEVPVLVGMRNVLTNTATGEARFYRLKR